MDAPRHPLEPDAEATRALGDAAVGLLARFVEERDAAPAVDLDGAAELARELRSAAPPEDGLPYERALGLVERAAEKAIDTAGPGYLGYIPGGGLVAAALAELLSNGLNRFTSIPALAPALAAIEANVVDWLLRLFGMPEASRGILTSGGSLANFSAVVTARASLGEDFLDGVLYVSEHAHHSVAKAARLAGLPARAVRVVPSDERLRMDPAALGRTIAEDRAAGLRPFLVVASAGTTNTGAVDPLPALAGLAERERLWLHVDAAYGGFFQLTERGRERLAGIERADSITLDPHKGMFLPYGTGCLLVRDGERLRHAHSLDASYLPESDPSLDLPNFADLSPELSREHRGLRLWLPLQLHGVGAFRRALDEKLDLTSHAHERLRAVPGLELPWEPELTIVAFRPREGGDEAGRALLRRINAARRVFLSSTVVGGRHTLRICILSHRTHRDRIEEAVGIVAREAAALSARA